MNSKQLIILLAALVILGGAGLVMHNHHEESWTSTGGGENKLGQKVLPNFQVNDVAAIHIKAGEDLNIVHKNDQWVVKERDNYPANFSQVKELLLKMGDLKVAQSEPIGPSQLARMHLADSGADAATVLEFQNAQGKVLDSLLLGKKHVAHGEASPRMPWAGGDMPDGRYVMLKNDPTDLLTVSDPLNTVDPKPEGWLNKDFFKVDKIKSIAFVSTNAADSWTLTRETDSGPWVLENKKAGEELDTNKVSSLSSTLSYPSFVDVAADPSPAKTGLDKPLVITITTFDKFVYTIKVGSKAAQNNYNMTVSVEGKFATERTPEKGESADAKKKLDTVFKDNLMPSVAKLAQEKTLDKATYLVNSWLIDPLIRHRSELLVDKNAQKKEAKASTESAPDEKPDGGLDLAPLGSKK
jgi:hypothetical protein